MNEPLDALLDNLVRSGRRQMDRELADYRLSLEALRLQNAEMRVALATWADAYREAEGSRTRQLLVQQAREMTRQLLVG